MICPTDHALDTDGDVLKQIRLFEIKENFKNDSLKHYFKTSLILAKFGSPIYVIIMIM
jgi:hypothetical protein